MSVSLMRILQVGEAAQGQSHSILRCWGSGLEMSCGPCIPLRHNSAGEAQVMLQARL